MKIRFAPTLAVLSLLAFAGTANSQQTKPVKAEAQTKAVKTATGTPLEQVHAFIKEATGADKILKGQANWKTSLPRFPQLDFSSGETYYWNLETSHGDIKVKLFSDTAPNHVANFLYLTELGFFDGIIFHRVITNFMAQGGDPTGTGRGSPGYRFAGEFDKSVRHDRGGLLSMANAGPGTDGSQFFLTFVATPWLDGKHTIFGEITEGMDTLKKLESKGSQSGRPSEKMNIVRATITTK